MLTVPAFIDLHVHLREPGQTHKGDIAHETRAALAGGFRTVLAMPNTPPPPDTPERFRQLQRLLEEKAACRAIPCACMTQDRAGRRPAPLPALREAGAMAFSDDGSTTQDCAVMREVAWMAAQVDAPLVDHCEDGPSSREGEIRMVERDILLAQETGARFHLQHLSAREAVELLRQARRDGLPVTGEATPHHLALTSAALERWGADAKMAPPLREEADRLALVQAVAEGVITVIATDHAPHSPEEKALPFPQAPNGILGLESAFSVCNRVLVKSGAMSLEALLERLTTGPAQVLGLPLPQETIDLEPEGDFPVPPPRFSRARNSPWTGFPGWGRILPPRA